MLVLLGSEPSQGRGEGNREKAPGTPGAGNRARPRARGARCAQPPQAREGQGGGRAWPRRRGRSADTPRARGAAVGAGAPRPPPAAQSGGRAPPRPGDASARARQG